MTIEDIITYAYAAEIQKENAIAQRKIRDCK